MTREKSPLEFQPKVRPSDQTSLLAKRRLNLAVENYLVARMGKPTFKVINYHLEEVAGTDLSQIAGSPSVVEAGLKKIFGVGAPTIIRACIYAAFRAEGVIPDREYRSLEDAFSELESRISGNVIPNQK